VLAAGVTPVAGIVAAASSIWFIYFLNDNISLFIQEGSKMKTFITLVVAFVLGFLVGVTSTIIGQFHYCPFVKAKLIHKHE
jgi:putative flippase GtrA